ncbi:MAG: ABC transporter permease, partial [Candidatus Competibacteraceae bacterium]|nr:ABC transporter permease [Candidatus Competibacteraceae bacterium]
LGVIIGVAAVVTMMAVGAGAEARLAERIRSLGSNLLVVLPGSASTGGVRQGQGSELTLVAADGRAIQGAVPGVRAAAPLVKGSAQVVAGNRNWSTFVQGVTGEFFQVRDWRVARGTAFSAGDSHQAAKVALLGQTVARRLFPGEDPVGRRVRVDRTPFTVIGVMADKGQNLQGQDQDDMVLVPLTTAQKRLLGGQRLNRDLVNAILVQVEHDSLLPLAEGEIRSLLRQRHRLRPDQPEDFSVRNLTEVVSARQASGRILALLLAAVASVSLVVGGIGIMNIMLVSVTERTREVGLRMAVGATQRNILVQFLIEAVVLSLLGGLVGLGLGVVCAFTLSQMAGWPVLIQANALVLPFGFSVTVGVFFGLYPALRAARLDPIEALRHE